MLQILKKLFLYPQPIPLKDNIAEWLETPHQKTILEVCDKNNLDPSQIIKVVIFLAQFEGKFEAPILACIRGDQHINDCLLYTSPSPRD